MKHRSTFSWLLEFTGRKKSNFIWSVILAVLGVATSFIPYMIIADIVKNLLSQNSDWNYYLKKV